MAWKKVESERKYYHEKNRIKKLSQMKLYYQNNSEKIKEKAKIYYHSKKEEIKKRHDEWMRKTAIPRSNKRKLTRLLLIKLLTDEKSECKKCGYNIDIRALQIDHIYGNGNEDRRIFLNPVSMYEYYCNHLEEAFLQLQVLCANCNAIKTRVEKEWSI